MNDEYFITPWYDAGWVRLFSIEVARELLKPPVMSAYIERLDKQLRELDKEWIEGLEEEIDSLEG